MWGVLKEFASDDVTLCDYDYVSWWWRQRGPGLEQLFAVAHILGIRPLWIRYDPSTRKGWHVIIKWDKKMLPAEIVALQSVLGSDRRRETLNLMRVMSEFGPEGDARWNILYSGKLK